MGEDAWPGPNTTKFGGNASLPELCYYKGIRNGPSEYSLGLDWYHVLAAKLAFVLVFEVQCYYKMQ